jgi:hypothetical protein
MVEPKAAIVPVMPKGVEHRAALERIERWELRLFL